MPSPPLAYVALGSNVGDRQAMIARAIDQMNRAGLRVLRQSPLYETEPVGGPPQPWFLNAVAEVDTSLAPHDVLRLLRNIEQAMGRRRSIPSGPRTLDLDLLFHGEHIVRDGQLELPHPRLAQRRFVLAPLAELAPGLVHPLLRKTVAELLAQLSGGGEVRLWRPAKAADKTSPAEG